MTMNPLPPQAYTKETLLKAYQWLMGQNTSIKEMATTPDILVSLFLKATRDGDHVLQRPSIQNFKNELRSLAGMMTELDKRPPPTSPAHPTAPVAAPAKPAATSAAFSKPSASDVLESTPSSTPVLEGSRLQFQESSNKPPFEAGGSSSSSAAFENLTSLGTALDEATLGMIREVKADFNLSNDIEALRMLVKVGYVRAKSFLR